MHDEQGFSLLYPCDAKKPTKIILCRKDCKALFGNYLYHREIDLCDYMTDDVETIVYRQALFADLLTEASAVDLLKKLLPLLENMDELYRLRENSHHTEGHLYSIKLIELYLTFIDTAYGITSRWDEKVCSTALIRFANRIAEIALGESYAALSKNTRCLSHDVTQVKCVTVGMNLNEAFSPYEFGVLGFHKSHMQTAGLMDKLLGQGKYDELSALCPLKNTSKLLNKEEREFANSAIQSVLNRLFKSTIAEWEPAIKSFFRQHTKQFLHLIGEIKFLLFGFSLLEELKNKGLPLATPTIKPKQEKVFATKGLYNPTLNLPPRKVIRNDMIFDQNGMIYLLTGPNSGGKTVFLSAVGICQVYAQLGFPVPATEAMISPVERILVHLSDKECAYASGRLENECQEIKQLFDELPEYSLVLMDEAFSGTSCYEGAYIAFDVIAALSAFGCKGIFSTHIHELIAMRQEINKLPHSISKIDTLSAEIRHGETRTYCIRRTVPDGKSYAKQISDRHGLSYKSLLSARKEVAK